MGALGNSQADAGENGESGNCNLPQSDLSEAVSEHIDENIDKNTDEKKAPAFAPPHSSDLRSWAAPCGLLLVLLLIGLPPLFSWQTENQHKALSLANMRRIANGCLIYAQDWDYRLPPPFERRPDGFELTWARRVRPYVSPDDVFTNPSNPVRPFRTKLHDPSTGRRVDTSYALNNRFWNTFSPGPFPYENLEMPEQTAFIVEAGHMAANPRDPHIPSVESAGPAVDIYGDTTDHLHGLWSYPSVHGGKMDIVAADGHGVSMKVLYYTPADGPHDMLFGRMGETIYNWNGGHPNGQTDTPPRE